MQSAQFSTTNYMVPSNGQTHAVAYQGQFSATPLVVDWRQFAIDAQPFQPQGVFVDNTAGTTPLTITILPIGYKVVCNAGLTLQAQFPAPNGQTATITGDPANSASVVFVDFPVLPSGLSAAITNTVNVNLASVSAGVRVPVDPNPLAAGNTLPYRDQEYVPQAEFHYLSLSGATTSVNVTPTIANQNLRKLKISASGDATLAAAGEITLTATLNGSVIFTRTVYLTATTPAGSPMIEVLCDENFDMIGLPAAAGNLTVSITTALATGKIDINAYFTPQ